MNLSKELTNLDYYRGCVTEIESKGKRLPLDFPLSKIIKDINSYKFSAPRKIQIPKSDGKSFRDIYIFNESDSFFLKVLNLIFVKNFSKEISSNVFSYTKGIRTYDAGKYIQKKLNSGNLYGFKLDISNYFLSIDEIALKDCIDSLVEDSDGRLFMYNLFNIFREEYIGILPGSAISSFFANYLLKDLDNYLAKECSIYARYSDDMIIFAETKEDIKRILNEIFKRLKGYGLHINPNKISEIDCSKPIDFLGLLITKSYIDISKSTESNIKKFIKKTCIHYRDLSEKHGDSNRIKYVRYAINKLNKSFYKKMLDRKSEHKSSRMSYILANVSTDVTLKRIDEYTIQCLNYVLNGTFNRSSKHKNATFYKELGFVPCRKYWNLYKMDKDVLLNRIACMGNTKYTISPIFNRKKVLERITETESINIDSFYELLLKYENIKFIIKDYEFSVGDLNFCIEREQISLGNVLLYNSGRFIVDSLLCKYDNRYFKINCSNLKLINNFDESNLLNLYLNAYNELDTDYTESNRCFTINCFRRYLSSDILMSGYDKEIDFEKPRFIKNALFYTYLLGGIEEGFINDSRTFYKYKEGDFSLVVDFELLYK